MTAAMPAIFAGMQQNVLISPRRCPAPFSAASGPIRTGRNTDQVTATCTRRSRQRDLSVGCAAQLQQQTLQACSEADVDGMTAYLDSLKWDANGLVAAIVQVPPDAQCRLKNAHALKCPAPRST